MVIGIIAVLISLLLPALGKAREAAKRAQCLSNLRQIATMLNMYAAEYKQEVPLGFASSGNAGAASGNNYFISFESATPDGDPPMKVRWIGLGLFFKAGYIKEQNADGGSGRVMFCPSAEGDVWHGFDAINNKWPPSERRIRISYSSRGSTDNVNAIAGSHATDSVAWTYKLNDPFYPRQVKNGAFVPGVGGSLPPKANMFKLSKLKNRAIVSDTVSNVDRPLLVHKKGINVLYANGGAKWVDLKLVTPQLKRPPGQFASDGSGNFITDQIWNNLDADDQLYP